MTLSRFTQLEKKQFIKYLGLLLLCILVTLQVTTIVEAATLNISYNGKSMKYKGKQANVYLDNKKIDMKGTKGILIKGNVLVSYKDVFASGLKAKATYNSSKKEIVIKQNNIEIKMKLGSKTAYVNGKKKTMPIAPGKVKYIKKKQTKVVVPLRFVAENLGYSCSWNKSKGNMSLKSPFAIRYNSNWTVYNKYKGNVRFDDSEYSLSSEIPAISINGTTMIPAQKVFSSIMGVKYDYSSSSGTLVLTIHNNVISMKVDDKLATYNGENFTLPVAPTKVKRKDTGKTYLMVPASVVCKTLGFYYEWDSANSKSIIYTKTFFNWNANSTDYDKVKFCNGIQSVTSNYDKGSNSIQVTLIGLSSEVMQKSEYKTDGLNLEVVIPDTCNLLGNTSAQISSKLCNTMSIKQNEDGSTSLFINSSKPLNYTHNLSNATITITIAEPTIRDYTMKIPLPSGVDVGSITNIDYYNENKFVINIPGNFIEFYNTNQIQNSNSNVTSISPSFTLGITTITVCTSILQGYSISNDANFLYVKIGSPRDIYKNIVVFDPGHGGTDPGATCNGTNEKDLNFIMLYTYMKSLTDSPSSSFKAYWTRTTDTFISLQERAAFSKKVGADLFVSLHMNSYTSSSAKGTEVYYSTTNNSSSFSGINSATMANLIQTNLVSNLGTYSRGVKTANYTVIKSNTVPAVLIELGFISNPNDYSQLINTAYQQKASSTIFNTVNQIFGSYPTGR